MRQDNQSLFIAVLSIVAIGIVVILVLPLVAILTTLLQIDFIPLVLHWIAGGLFPFVFAEQVFFRDGFIVTTPITHHPLLLTALQWAALAVGNLTLVRVGLSKRPLVSALAITALSAGTAAFCIWVSGYQLATIRT